MTNSSVPVLYASRWGSSASKDNVQRRVLDWDGTWPGWFKVLLAAFAIDVSTDTLLEKVKPA